MLLGQISCHIGHCVGWTGPGRGDEECVSRWFSFLSDGRMGDTYSFDRQRLWSSRRRKKRQSNLTREECMPRADHQHAPNGAPRRVAQIMGDGRTDGWMRRWMDGLIDANLIVRRNAYLWFGIGTPPVMIGDVRAYLDTHLRMYVRRRRSDLRTYVHTMYRRQVNWPSNCSLCN